MRVYTDQFESFWKAYPWNANKVDAFAEWNLALERASFAEIMAKLPDFHAYEMWRAGEPGFMKHHAHNWLKKDRWEESYEVPKAHNPKFQR